MARVTKEHDERLNELLQAAQQLFFQKGYEQTSVNDIIEKVGIAKGTFYHYFKSKHQLLDELVERFTQVTYVKIKAVVDEEGPTALEKYHNCADEVRQFKMANKELMKMLMKVMYNDDNLRYRYKMFKRSIEVYKPEYVRIIAQGIEEGVFNVDDPEEAAEVLFTMGQTINESIVELVLELDQKPENLEKIDKKFKNCERSIERILGAPKGSINIFKTELIKEFMIDSGDKKS